MSLPAYKLVRLATGSTRPTFTFLETVYQNLALASDLSVYHNMFLYALNGASYG